MFFLNLPIALATIWITLRKIEGEPSTSKRKDVDWAGGALSVWGLGGLTFALMQWSSGGRIAQMAGSAGLLALGALIAVERKVSSPLIPLHLFHSRMFSGANLLTFFLYAALAIVLFYLPLNLIQVQGYSPSAAGGAMLPLVITMFVLSRWAGGLFDRFGARLPLVVGPFLASIGFALLCLPGVGGPYWTTYLPAIVLLGVGLAVSVAPLTTVVMNSVMPELAGSASGINNAVSQTAALLAVAVLSPIFLAVFSSVLHRTLVGHHLPPQVVEQIEKQAERLAAIQTSSELGRAAVRTGFVAGFRLVALVASVFALMAAGIAAISFRQTSTRLRNKNQHESTPPSSVWSEIL